MKKLLALLALLLGAILPMPVLASGKDCNKANDPLCDAYKHPQKRVLKSAPCVPIRFDQEVPGTVVIEVIHPRLGTMRRSDHFGTTGQYCPGVEQWLRESTVTICDDAKSYVWTPDMITAALARQKTVPRLDGTLKGTVWYKSHPEKYD